MGTLADSVPLAGSVDTDKNKAGIQLVALVAIEMAQVVVLVVLVAIEMVQVLVLVEMVATEIGLLIVEVHLIHQSLAQVF